MVLGLFAAVPLALWWFVRVERRAPHPLIPLEWFRRPSFRIAVAIGFFIQFGYMGGFTLTPKLLAEVSGMDAVTLTPAAGAQGGDFCAAP